MARENTPADCKEYNSLADFRRDFPRVYPRELSEIKIEPGTTGLDREELGSELFHSYIFQYGMSVSTSSWLPVSRVRGAEPALASGAKLNGENVIVIPIIEKPGLERENYWVANASPDGCGVNIPLFAGNANEVVLRTFGPTGTNRYVACIVKSVDEFEDVIDLHGEEDCDCKDLKMFHANHIANVKFVVHTPKTNPFFGLVHEILTS